MKISMTLDKDALQLVRNLKIIILIIIIQFTGNTDTDYENIHKKFAGKRSKEDISTIPEMHLSLDYDDVSCSYNPS